MQLKKVFVWTTGVGPFYIAQSDDGRYHPVFDDESLGSYDRPEQAAEDLAGGHTFSVVGSEGIIDTSGLGIPEDLEKWARV